MKNKFLLVLKWGALLGIALSVVEFVKSYSRNLNFTSYDQIFSISCLLITIFALYLAVKEIREANSDKLISYPKAFGFGVLTVIVAFFVLFFYLFLHYSYIDKDGLQKINAQNVQKYNETVAKDTITSSEINLFLIEVDSIVEQNMEKQIVSVQLDSEKISVLDSSVCLVMDFYKMYVLHHKLVDSSQFILSQFDVFAKKSLVDAFEHFNHQNCFNEELGTPLTEIFLNTAIEISSISPLQKRIDDANQNVPQHTNVLTASFIFSLSLLLYGTFCALFVALYLYRKFKPDSSDNSSETSEETPSDMEDSQK